MTPEESVYWALLPKLRTGSCLACSHYGGRHEVAPIRYCELGTWEADHVTAEWGAAIEVGRKCPDYKAYDWWL